jgi:hypothetical protein
LEERVMSDAKWGKDEYSHNASKEPDRRLKKVEVGEREEGREEGRKGGGKGRDKREGGREGGREAHTRSFLALLLRPRMSEMT